MPEPAPVVDETVVLPGQEEVELEEIIRERHRQRVLFLIALALIVFLLFLFLGIFSGLELGLVFVLAFLGIFAFLASGFLFSPSWSSIFAEVFGYFMLSSWALFIFWGSQALDETSSSAHQFFYVLVLLSGVIVLELKALDSAQPRTSKFRRMALSGDVRGLAMEMKQASFIESPVIAKSLGKMADEGQVSELVKEGAVVALIEALKYEDETGELRDALWRIARAGERDYVVARLLEGLESEDLDVQYLSADTLGRLGDQTVIPFIEKLLEDDEEGWEDEFSKMARKAIKKLQSGEDWTIEKFNPDTDEAFDILEGLIEEQRTADTVRVKRSFRAQPADKYGRTTWARSKKRKVFP